VAVTAPNADVTAPSISAIWNMSPDAVPRGANLQLTVDCIDQGVGVEHCGFSPAIDTTQLGTRRVVISAWDRNGNTRRVETSYSVIDVITFGDTSGTASSTVAPSTVVASVVPVTVAPAATGPQTTSPSTPTTSIAPITSPDASQAVALPAEPAEAGETVVAYTGSSSFDYLWGALIVLAIGFFLLRAAKPRRFR
jgi:hypothetical protein